MRLSWSGGGGWVGEEVECAVGSEHEEVGVLVGLEVGGGEAGGGGELEGGGRLAVGGENGAVGMYTV